MRKSGSNLSNTNLVSGCLGIFQKTLSISFEGAISDCLKNLFIKAENASSNQQETQLFEQYNRLKKNSGKLLDSMAAITNSMPDEITEKISLSDDEVSLSLVAEEELEISLAFTQLESVLDIKFSNYLFALEKRLKILFASKNITKSNMPFGIASICWIFSQTLDLIEINVSIKTSLVESIKKHLLVNLPDTYKSIDKKFVDAGILPNIKKTVKSKRQSAFSNMSNQQQNSQQKDGMAPSQEMPQSSANGIQNFPQDNNGLNHSPVPNANPLEQNQQPPNSEALHSRSAELVNSIFDLMNQGRQHGLDMSQASNIDNTMMDNTLQNLSEFTSVAAGSTEIDKLKEMILDDVRNETGIYYPSLSRSQQNSLDVMGMFYEEVKADPSIDNNIVSSLNAINIPLIRTAINDNDFFENTNHPAREYLEKIIYASQKWHGTSVVKKLHKFSESVASDFDGSTDSFDEANDTLDSYLRLTERRAKKAEEKWVKAAKGKEKLELSRHKVEEVVENVAKKAKPEFVQNVIKYVLQDALTLSLLRHGEDSEEWHKNINTSETIAKMANPELIKELTPKQKIESLHHLDQTMDELGFSKNDRKKTLNNIKDCAEAAVSENLTEDIRLDDVPTINKNKKNVKKAGSVKIEELRELTKEEKSELTRIRLMPYGTLFDFLINQQREKIRRKLSWFSPVSNKALFVSLLGNKPYERSLNAIAIDIVRKNIIEVKVEQNSYFDNVLGGIFSKLKNMVNPVSTSH